MLANKIVILAAPSGSGKTSIARYLLTNMQALSFSISATTRPPRGQEQDKKDYYFLSQTEFESKIAEGEFLEWEMVYPGKYYGTLKNELTRMWSLSKIPLLDVDVQGAIRVKQLFGESSLSIFVDVPSIDELYSRLVNRGTETPESLAARINKATYEREFKRHFDVIIVNDDLLRAQKEALQVVTNFLTN